MSLFETLLVVLTLAYVVGTFFLWRTGTSQHRLTRQSLETTKQALQTDLLMRLQEKMDSPQIRSWRQTAARKLLAKEMPNSELGDLLDFFATIGFLYERKAVDTDLAYKNFSWWMIRFWLSAEDFVKEERKRDPLGWKTLEEITARLKERELKDGYPPYTAEGLQAFLQEEARLSVSSSAQVAGET
jgi:hypothetical protein